MAAMSDDEAFLRSIMLHEDSVSDPRVVAMAALRASGIPFQEYDAADCPGLQWDGARIAIPSGYTPQDILHEICHWLVADEARRPLAEYGLGPGFDCGDPDAAEDAALADDDLILDEECLACLVQFSLSYRLGMATVPTLKNYSFLWQGEISGLRAGSWRRFEDASRYSDVIDALVKATTARIA